MKSMASILTLILMLSCLAPVAAGQGYSFTVTADSLIAGNAGKLVRSVEGDFVEDIAFFEEDGKHRIYALRELGFEWDPFASPVYLVPVSTMSIGDSWAIYPGDLDEPQTAEVVAIETVVVQAGSFDNAYRVDVKPTGAGPGVSAVESFWFVDGVGFVLNQGFLSDGSLDWSDELQSYEVSGTGFMPMDVGNAWTYETVFGVANAEMSFGDLKARY